MTQRFWWLNLIRGCIALIIGLLIFVWFQTARNLFVNFFAVYWLSSGLLGLQWSVSSQQKKGWRQVLNLLEIVVGAALLLRPLYAHYLDPGLGIKIFGLIAFCVGLARIFSEGTSRDMTHEQSLGLLLLGLFGVGLGLLLIFSGELQPFTKLLAGSWAFVGGILLILQSLQVKKSNHDLSLDS